MMRSCENLSSFVIANERSKVWQSIEFELPCISGFYFVQRTRPAFFALRKTAMLAKPRKNSLTLIFARNDRVCGGFYKKFDNFLRFFFTFFANFHSHLQNDKCCRWGERKIKDDERGKRTTKRFYKMMKALFERVR